MALALHAFHVSILTGQEIVLLCLQIALKQTEMEYASSASLDMRLQLMNLVLNLKQGVPELCLKVANACAVYWDGCWMIKAVVFSYRRAVQWEKSTGDVRFVFQAISSSEEAYAQRFQSDVWKLTWAECARNAKTGLKSIQSHESVCKLFPNHQILSKR